MPRTIRLTVSIDTEEDNWQPRRDGVTIENIRELPRLDGLFQRLGVRATYFTSYQVAVQEWAAATIRQLRGGGGGGGGGPAPPRPRKTPPPGGEPSTPRNCMLCIPPPQLQLAKLERLT